MSSVNVNLPETLKIRTMDNKVMEITGKLINESEVLKKAFEMHDNSEVGEMIVPVVSAGLQNALQLLQCFDLEQPHVPPTTFEERKAFQEEGKAALDFLEKLPPNEMFDIAIVADGIDCVRLIDICMVFVLIKSAQSSSVDERRKLFGLKNDYTKEEEAEIFKRHEA